MEGDGVANSYAIDGNKPAIITKEQFEEAQKERLRRSNIVVDEYGSSKRKSTHYSMKKPSNPCENQDQEKGDINA
ncbi:MAG: hypothetical protein GXY61_04795 [Lentisphaerae bacterium]|nr:hypothetical protein [Lentisphaerota bacterium]